MFFCNQLHLLAQGYFHYYVIIVYLHILSIRIYLAIWVVLVHLFSSISALEHGAWLFYVVTVYFFRQ